MIINRYIKKNRQNIIRWQVIAIGCLFLFNTNIFAAESEDKIKAVIVGKVAKFVAWNKDKQDKFIITVLNNPFGTIFEKTYSNRLIKNKAVEILYIDNISALTETHVLFIPELNRTKLAVILKEIRGKKILTISDSRGFAEMNGMEWNGMVNFVSQKIKLKINYGVTKKEHLKINPILLKIAEIVKTEIGYDKE